MVRGDANECGRDMTTEYFLHSKVEVISLDFLDQADLATVYYPEPL